MSRTLCLIALAIVAVFISSDRAVQAASPTTQPDLVAENALLKKIIAEDAIKNDELINQFQESEAQNIRLRAEIHDLQQMLAKHDETMPNPPYRIQPPTPSPYTPDPDSILGSFKYNSKTVYLVGPMISKPMTYQVKGPDRMDQGTITFTSPVSATPVKP